MNVLTLGPPGQLADMQLFFSRVFPRALQPRRWTIWAGRCPLMTLMRCRRTHTPGLRSLATAWKAPGIFVAIFGAVNRRE